MKRFLISIFLFALLALPARAAEKNKIVDKTKDVIGSVKDTLAQPVQNPRAAFSRWFEFNPEIEKGEKTNFNILPLFISSPERGQGLGLKYAQESIWKKRDVLRTHILHTLKNRQEYRIKYESSELIKRWDGEFEAAFSNYSRFYYGIGNGALKEDETEYTLEFFEVRLPFLYRIRRHVFAGLALNFENFALTEIGREGILRQDLPKLIGRDGSRLYTTNLFLRWDNRNSKTNPSNGNYIEASQEYSKKLLGSETDFSRTTMDARRFFPLFGRKGHVFCAKLFLNYKNGDVPFYHLPELGGVFINRGLIEGRFRDNLSISGNAEYRLRIYERLHWAFFIDAGNIYRDFAAMTTHRTKFTGGTGMRYYVPPGNLLLARVDGGYSAEGFLVYLTFDHPF